MAKLATKADATGENHQSKRLGTAKSYTNPM